jgi:hypothetical protein
LWEGWKNAEGKWVKTCAILTTTPNAVTSAVHDRMPVIVHREASCLTVGLRLFNLPSQLVAFLLASIFILPVAAAAPETSHNSATGELGIHFPSGASAFPWSILNRLFCLLPIPFGFLEVSI